jgi:thiamine biosynthesis lipoprotein
MRSSSRPPLVERARPLLGTRVAIRVLGLPEEWAHRAIDAAFREIGHVHARMSFHEPGSDIGRLNREAFHRPVAVDACTIEVLEWSRRIAEGSRGCFDVTVAPQLVDWGLLPPPDAPHRPDREGSWRDVEILADRAVRFHRRVWIDLGGIAKGYAVDRAVECLRRWGVRQGCVNAGGDLRVWGPLAERVRLDWTRPGAPVVPVLDLENGAVASSSGVPDRSQHPRPRRGPHVHGRERRSVGTRSFVAVVAERCVVADGLTKVVLAQGKRSEDMLRHYRASAHLYRPGHGWRSLATSR